MLHDLGWLKQVKIQDSSGTVINPSTNEKLEELKVLLQKIDQNTDELEVTTDNIKIESEQINLNTDTLEAKVQSVRDQLDVLLSTRASESKLQEVLDALGTESGTDILSEIQEVLSKLNVDLSTRASEATLVQIKDYLDTVEIKLQSIIDKLDVSLSTRASETTLQEVRDTIGQESASTVLSKLKDLYDKLTILFTDGTAKTRIIGRNNLTVKTSAFGILKTASDALLNAVRWSVSLITTLYTVAITNLGSWSIVDSTSLKLETGADVNSGISITANDTCNYLSGKGILLQISIFLGDSGVAGNVREWGLFNDNNGVFVRLNGTQYEFVIRNNTVETVILASNWDIPVTPDDKGHLWYIQYQWLGVGNFYLYYDEQLVYTHVYLGTATKVSIENPDLPVRIRNYNTTNNTNIFIKSGCSSVSIEGINFLYGKDTNKQAQEVKLSADGRLLVSTTSPAPPETTPVDITESGDVVTVSDNVYVIPNGETLEINRFSAGAEVDATAGSVIELYYDPNGTGVGMTLLDAIFASGSSDQHDENISYLGNGTIAIRLRRRRLTGGSKEIFGRWEGYY
jgi:hypothetical protein